MKKLIALLLLVVFSNCEIKVKQVTAQAEPNWKESQLYGLTGYKTVFTEFKRITIDSMEFGLFQSNGSHSYGIPFVINLTKEKLEVELLKKQLK